MSKVVELKELRWRFDSDRPFLSEGEWWPQIHVDPCPGYAHGVELVVAEAERLEIIVPLPNPPTIYLLSYECPSRTNGWAEEYGNQIVLSGKRIPPHPAMTRYLVAHEYGHHVEYALRKIRDDKNLIEKYQKLRGGTLEYGPGFWHMNTRELFANDFRILVAGSEVDFWPHPDFPHPSKLSHIQDYWADAVEELEIEATKV